MLHSLTNLTTGANNTALGSLTGNGIITGSNNTILGANITGLASDLSGNIILADGQGNIKLNEVAGTGWVMGSPTGGPQGADSLNAAGGVFDNGTPLSPYPFDAYLDGDIDTAKWDAKVGKRHDDMRKFKARLGTDTDPLDLDKYINHWKTKRHLTSLVNPDTWNSDKPLSTGQWIQRLLETVEIHAIHVSQLHDRIKELENAD